MSTLSRGGIRVYSHTQSSAQTTWTVSHNLNADIVISEVISFDGANQVKAFPATYNKTDNNTLTITWSSARTGSITVAAAPTV